MFVYQVPIVAVFFPALQVRASFHFARCLIAIRFLFAGTLAFARLFLFGRGRVKSVLILVPAAVVWKEAFAFPAVRRSVPVVNVMSLLSLKMCIANVVQKVVWLIQHWRDCRDR